MTIITRGKSINAILTRSFFILLFSITYFSHSQFYHGLDVGVNSTTASFNINQSNDPSRAIGFFVGYVAERELSDRVFVRTGLNFNRRSFKANYRRGVYATEERWSTDVIEIPINLGYYLNYNRRNSQFFIDAGFNIGYNNRAITKNDIETVFLDIGSDDDIKRMAFGANAGAGILIKKRIKLRLNYYHGLTNIANTDGSMWKNKTIGISINYFLREKEVY